MKTISPGGFLVVWMFASIASANVVLNEAFPDGQRLVQDLPNTAAWYGTGGSTGTAPTMSDPGGILTVDMSGNAQILAYFTGAPVSLAVGEILNISFGFQMTGALSVNQGVRIGVMDSSDGGGRVTADASGTAPGSGLFNGYTGYGVFFNPKAGANIRKRNPAENALLSLNGVWPAQTSVTGVIDVQDGNNYSAEIVISRLSDGVDVTYNLSGPTFTTATQSFTDTGSELFAYDTLGIWLNAGAGASFSLTGVEITVVPEPSTWALFTGPAILGAVFLRCRRKF